MGSFINEFLMGFWGKVFVEFDYVLIVISVFELVVFSLFGVGFLFLLLNRRKVIKKWV